MEETLGYKNEDDKCYGATGMAVAVVVFDGERYLAAVDLDADPGSMLEMTDDFYFTGSPALSAKSVWNRILQNYNLTLAMSLANVMCRSIVRDRKPLAPAVRERLRRLSIEQGNESCSLDEDESGRLFDKNYTYLTRVFNHTGIGSVCHDFADTLKRRRRLTRHEILEELRAIGMM